MRTTHRHIVSLFISFALPCVTASATELGDSTDTYQSHTVSTEVFVQGRDTLTSSDVTVTPGGRLTMTAPNRIVITGSFDVQLGGMLELNGGRQYLIRYTYDAAGNRVNRKHE